MSETLLPCPFCGGEAEIHPSDDWDVKFTGDTYFVWCDKCETRGDYYNTEAEAIAAWNTRAERTCNAVRHVVTLPVKWTDREVRQKVVWTCSECGSYISLNENYCHSCGAKVVEHGATN